jgi:hypothetical protein
MFLTCKEYLIFWKVPLTFFPISRIWRLDLLPLEGSGGALSLPPGAFDPP